MSDLLNAMAAVHSCFVQGVGYFHMKKLDSGKFNLALVRRTGEKVFFKDTIEGGQRIEKMFGLDGNTVLVKFAGNEDLLILESDNYWRTIQRKERHPPAMFLPVLDLNEEAPSRAGLGPEDAVVESVFEGKTVSIPVHSTIMSRDWANFREEFAKGNNVKVEFPERFVKIMIAHLYGERKQMDLNTATGIVALACMQHLPELMFDAAKSIFADDMSDFMKLHTWKQTRRFSETVAVFCADGMKNPDREVTPEFQKHFTMFFQMSTPEELQQFQKQLSDGAMTFGLGM